MSSKVESKEYEEKEEGEHEFDIVKEVAELIYADPDLGDRFETWVDSHAEVFDLKADPSEHRLEYTDLYQEYQRMLEVCVMVFLQAKTEPSLKNISQEQIGDLLERRKVRVTEFYEILRRAIDEDPAGETAMFAQILRHVADYDIFVQMLRQAAEKRERRQRRAERQRGK
eukprot:scaffold47_cov258-Pinguiococcus_pyrenoidosus.AAC.75